MTQSCLKYIVFLLRTLFLFGNFYGPSKTLQVDPDSKELQCNNSTKIKPYGNYIHEISCGLNSRTLVKFIADYIYFKDLHDSYIQFNCYNATPLRFSLPLNMHFLEMADTVQFNSCRFSSKDDISKILKHSLRLKKIKEVTFENELVLSRVHLKPLNLLVKGLSFNINNLSTLPIDLFDDIKALEKLSIYSNSMNSSYLSKLLAPLTYLNEIFLGINGLQELPGSIFTHMKKLFLLDLRYNTVLSPGFFSHFTNLQRIYLHENNFSSLPINLFLETKTLKRFVLADNKIALKRLPKGLLGDLPILLDVDIIGCGLESIPADIFAGSKRLQYIRITGHNLYGLPLQLFADQDELYSLDLSRNRIRALTDGLFDFNKHLYRLNLSDNQLVHLSKNIFKPLTQLRHLYLENNNLLTMSWDYNQPQQGSVFDNLEDLAFLHLKNNSINEISYSIMNKKKILNVLDLSFNNISSINCNFVTYFDSMMIDLTKNKFNCDCEVICLQQFIVHGRTKENHALSTIQCEIPSKFKGRLLQNISLDELLSWPDIHQTKISKGCTYNIRLTNSVLVMNCSNGNFTDIPMLPMPDQSFSNGIELIMNDNPLTELSSKTLKDRRNIILLSILNSSIHVLPKGFLAKMTKLQTVLLVLPLREIAEDIFLDSYSIQKLILSGTYIKKLPEKIFASQKRLIYLDLSKNKLEKFNLDGLKSNRNLETLKLSDNCLQYFSMWTYNGLANLKKLFLDNNRLKSLLLFMSFSKSLEFLNLESNEFTDIESIGKLPGTLHTLILRNNSVQNISSLGLYYSVPGYIDLSLNKFHMIDFSYLDSVYLNKTVLNFTDNDFRTIKVRYRNISYNCDCEIHSFVKDKNLKNIYDSLRCLSPNNFKERQISILPQEELLCPVKSSCPTRCLCWFRPAHSTLIANCANVSLAEAPSLSELETTFLDGIELLIAHNHLRSLKPNSQAGYKSVTKIFAAHNNITNISVEDIGGNLSLLDISYNQLERLDDGVIKAITERQNLRSIFLYHNPIICDCSSENLTRLILTKKQLLPNMDECGDGRKFKALSFSALCYSKPSIIEKVIYIVVIVIICALFALTVVYFKKKESILIWLYAHNLCLWCVTEEELDKDKKYDAFISYSSLDADFVALNLVSKLESGPNPYKLCLHDRDWLGGGYIPHQIEKSVDRSRRTLIVMSQNYINSRWTRLEFRTAHNASMNEKRPRVIVVMIDDKVDLKDLDSDLRKYIKMYTYLRWGDSWFWDRLKYALPHPSQKNQDIKKYKVKMTQGGDGEAGTGYSSDDNELF